MSKALQTANDVLAANLHALMRKQGVVQTVLAQRSGVGQTTISLYLSPERRQPSKTGKMPSAKLTEIEALASALGVTVVDLLTPDFLSSVEPAKQPSQPRRGSVVSHDDAEDPFPMLSPAANPPWAGGITTKQMERAESVRLASSESLVVNVAPGSPYAANDKFEKVPELADVRLAAGDGIENHSESQTGVMQFRSSFLRSVGADQGSARVVYAKGDSMEPVIRDGSTLLVVPVEGLNLRTIAPGGVYALNYDGKMIVKVLARDNLTGGWVARSFNTRYPDVSLDAEVPVRVLGRVVWVGSRLDI